MFIGDQPEERTVLCLKRRDYNMDCMHCQLPRRLKTQSQPTQSLPVLSDDDRDNDVAPPPRNFPISITNSVAQLSSVKQPERDPSHTFLNHLNIGKQTQSRYMSSAQLSTTRYHLITQSAHELLPSLACFLGLTSPAFNLYRIVTFDKLHVIDLGLIKQFCDLTMVIISRDSPLPLTLLMSIQNDRYPCLPTLAHLSSHCPFWTTRDESQAVISGKYAGRAHSSFGAA